MKKNLLLVSLAVVLLAGAAGYAYWRRDPGTPTRYPVYGVCLACKQEGTGEYGPDERPPVVCPHCGEQALYPWYICRSCAVRFVPALRPTGDGTPPALPLMPPCPKCGGTATGTWDPGFDEGVATGDMPLPPWPPK